MSGIDRSYKVFLKLLFVLPLFFTVLSLPERANADDTKKDNPVTGAGAHFAWVIFDSLKDELEQSSGRKISLFGKGASLGMGCNSGIKLAAMSSSENETFGFVCCPLSDHEVHEKKIKVYPLADEPILILVNKDNPVDNLSIEQVRAMFSGKITNWKQVGGWDKAVVVVTRLHCKKRPGHWKTILPDAAAFTKTRINVPSAKEMVKRVTDFKTAIGHTGATWEFDRNSHVKAITVGGVAATSANLKNKTYPFHRRLSAITSLAPSETVVKIIKQVQEGESFGKVAKKYNLLPAK